MDNYQNTNSNLNQPNPYIPDASSQDPYIQLTKPQFDTPYASQAPVPDPYMQNQAPQQNPYMPSQAPQQNPYMQNQGPQSDPYLQLSQGYPGYNQAPGMYQQPASSFAVPSKKTPVYTPEQVRKARILCIASLIFYVAPRLLMAIASIFTPYMSAIFFSKQSNASPFYSLSSIFYIVAELLSVGCQIAAIVLMIIARVKYPKFLFAKILMWVYIALTILAILAIILIALFFFSLLNACLSV